MTKSHFSVIRALTIIALVAWPFGARAENYELSVSRQDSNVYVVHGKDLLIKTKYCHERVRREDAILRTETRKLIFLDEGTSCDVDTIYGKANIQAGTYEVTVTRSEDNAYEVMGTGLLINTAYCLNLALSADALLKMTPFGSGYIVFLDDSERCDVQTVYSELRLR